MAISHRGTGTYVDGANDFTPTIPGGTAAGDMMLLLVGGKPYNGTFGGSMAPGWTQLAVFTDGTVAAGVDTGSMQVTAWYKEHDGSEANPLVDEGGTVWNVMSGIVMTFQKDAADTWQTPVIVGGGDAVAGTAFSVTAGSNPGVVTGDQIVSFAAFRTELAVPCSSHLTPTQTGVTFTNTHDPATDHSSLTGGDMGMCITRSTVSGTGSAAPVMAATLAAGHTGSAAFLRLRVTTAFTGTVAETLDPFTSSASGTVINPVTGTVAETLDPFTSSASGTVDAGGVTGTVAETLDPFTSTASGTNVAFQGTVAETLDPFTSTASGTVTAPPVSGTLAETLDPFVSTASGTYTPPPITGSLAETLNPFISTASGTEFDPVNGTVAVTLAPFVPSAAGTYTPPPISGSSARTLGPFTSTAAGTVINPITGTSARTLAPFVATASGTVLPPPITGTLAETLDAFVSAASGFSGGSTFWTYNPVGYATAGRDYTSAPRAYVPLDPGG